jgi:thymidylate kinase
LSQLVHCLVEALKCEGIVFCHWKSSFHLKDALAEGGDLDLLVDRKDAQRFERVLATLGFKRVVDPLQSFPSLFHFYGLDNLAGILVHIHVYYRVITGESLLKNYCLPLDGLLLHNPRLIGDMPAPQLPAELIVFVIRMMLKHASLLEYTLLRRGDRSGYTELREELVSLLVDDSSARASGLLADWLPPIQSELFCECIDALQKDAPFIQRFQLALRLRRQLKVYRRLRLVAATFRHATMFLTRILRRLASSGKTKQLASGGALIAFVGPEATGKSTLVQETVCWLGKVFDVSTAHLGKPPSTWLTFAPNLVLPLLRKATPQHRMSRVQRDPGGEDRPVSLLYALRAVLLAWDRRALAVRVRRKAAQGGIVICDRYPSVMVGAMDSARLKVPAGTGRRSRLLGFLARLENRLYRQIPPPDAVIRLTVPVEVAITRNQERQKKGKEADAYVLRRHTIDTVPTFPVSRTIELDSNQPRAQTISAARQIVWESL